MIDIVTRSRIERESVSRAAAPRESQSDALTTAMPTRQIVSAVRRTRLKPGSVTPGEILILQQAIGNRAVNQLPAIAGSSQECGDIRQPRHVRMESERTLYPTGQSSEIVIARTVSIGNGDLFVQRDVGNVPVMPLLPGPSPSFESVAHCGCAPSRIQRQGTGSDSGLMLERAVAARSPLSTTVFEPNKRAVSGVSDSVRQTNGPGRNRDYGRVCAKIAIPANGRASRALHVARLQQAQELYGNGVAQRLVKTFSRPPVATEPVAPPIRPLELRGPSIDVASPPPIGPDAIPNAGSSDGLTRGSLDESVMIGNPAAAGKGHAPSSTGRVSGEPGSQLHAVADAQRRLILGDAERSEAQVLRAAANRRQQIGDRFGNVRQRISAVFAQSSTAVQSFVAEKQAQVQATSSNILNTAKGFMEGAVKTAERLANQARDGISGFVDNISSSLIGSAQGVAQQIMGVVSSIPGSDLPGVAQLRAAATRFVGQAAGAVTSALSQAQVFIHSVLQRGMEFLKSALTGFAEIANSTLAKVASGIQQAAHALFGFLRQIATRILSSLRTVVKGTLLPIVASVEGKAQRGVITAQQQAVAAIRNNLEDHLKALARYLSPRLTGTAAASGTGGAADPEAVVRAMGAEAVQNDHTIVRTFEERTSTILGSIFQALAGGASRAVQAIGQVVAEARQAIVAKIAQILEALSQITGAVSSVMQSLLQSIGESFVAVVQSVRILVQNTVDRLLDFARNALSRIGQLIAGFVSNLLSGNFSLPSLADVIGVFQPVLSNGPIEPRPPGPITKPGLQIIFLILAAVGALVLYVAPELAAAVIAALVAAGLSPVGALVVLGILAILALILLLLLLYLLWKLLNSKPAPKPKPPEPKITHETVFSARDGSPKTRTDIGVGEHVDFTGSVSGTWTANAGSPKTASGTKFAWVAPERKQTVTIQLTAGGTTASVSMKILEPDDITAVKEKERSIPAGVQGAGMILNFDFHPFNVSFGNVGTREVAGPASNIQGYYLKHGMPHDHNPGPVRFFPMSEDNKFAGTARDTAAQQGYPAPWDAGSFHWKIPNKFKVNTEGGDGKEYTNTIQEFTLTGPSGETKITKAGAEVKRTP